MGDSGYQVDLIECDAVCFMYQYYAYGADTIEISRKLETQGYKARQGIARHLIAHVLDNDFYIGHQTIKGQVSQSIVLSIFSYEKYIGDAKLQISFTLWI